MKLVHDVDRALHDRVDRVGVVKGASGAEGAAVGFHWFDIAGSPTVAFYRVRDDVIVGPRDSRAGFDGGCRWNKAVAGVADRQRDFGFIKLFVLGNGGRLRHDIGWLVVGRSLDRSTHLVVDEEAIGDVIDVLFPVQAVKGFGELFRTNASEEAALVNGVDFWISGNFDHFAAWAVGHIAAA